MATFEVTVYQSEGVTDYCNNTWGDPYRAEDRVKTYFGATSYDTHSVSVTKSGETIGVPTEATQQSFSAKYPCGTVFYDYEDLAAWWLDYIACYETEARDCDLLLTSADGGGLTRKDQFATAGRGHDLAKLPADRDQWGTSTGHAGMQTAMHEAGHAFLDKSASWEHNSGDVLERGGNDYRTPMGHGGSSGTNECGDSHPDHDDGYETLRWYANCAVANWTHTG